MYLLWFNASRVSYRVLTGACARRVCRRPSSRHGRAVPEAAAEGTCVQSVGRRAASHREVPDRNEFSIRGTLLRTDLRRRT